MAKRVTAAVKRARKQVKQLAKQANKVTGRPLTGGQRRAVTAANRKQLAKLSGVKNLSGK